MLASSSTHGAEECISSCLMLDHMIREGILTGVTGSAKVAQLQHAEGVSQEMLTRLLRVRLLACEDIRSTGYVMNTMQAALWSCVGAETFEEALVRAINLGDDADTLGAVAGQMCGACFFGASAIPERWLDHLAWRDELTELADQLFEIGRAGVR